ncbi:hypothetical protein QFW77_04080 [Luteimonas sp. RD2P54]|uniref:Uncharacterized protein n=1 Tax=Luteimonas endophytica TaxID=3042023 RepID=A0ABT6J5R9_9GAMM|nr:hypothetical protein [Luteimonas endophytica]MDH5822168.1 hypothetical protein [Luteimonas endophytica]
MITAVSPLAGSAGAVRFLDGAVGVAGEGIAGPAGSIGADGRVAPVGVSPVAWLVGCVDVIGAAGCWANSVSGAANADSEIASKVLRNMGLSFWADEDRMKIDIHPATKRIPAAVKFT